MKCPKCESESKTLVKETRMAETGEVARRRECTCCNTVFWTKEVHTKDVLHKQTKKPGVANPLFGVWGRV